MSRQPRDHGADRAAITAAADRLLAGTPLRSASGSLTQTELIAEAGLRRDIVYAHRDLVDQFKARVKNQHSTPAAMQALADQNSELTSRLRDLTAELARERQRTATTRQLAAELSLELQQAREELHAASAVTALHQPRPPELRASHP
jgi:hypothetical protein